MSRLYSNFSFIECFLHISRGSIFADISHAARGADLTPALISLWVRFLNHIKALLGALAAYILEHNIVICNRSCVSEKDTSESVIICYPV